MTAAPDASGPDASGPVPSGPAPSNTVPPGPDASDTAGATPARRGPGRRPVVLAGIVAAGALAGSTRTVWVQALAPDLTGTAQSVDVVGGDAAPAVLALALVGLAAAVTTSLSSRWVRLVTGPVMVLAGIGAGLAALDVRGDPVAASTRAVAAVTGVVGGDAQAAATAWPLLALVPALALAGIGVLVLLVGGRWPHGSRYRRTGETTAAHRAADPSQDPAAAWDALTRGEDPSAEDPGIENPGIENPRGEDPEAALAEDDATGPAPDDARHGAGHS